MTSRATSQQNVANRHDLFGFIWDSLEAESSADDPFIHRSAFGERRFLAVVGDGNAECARVFERATHQLGAGDRLTVVTDSNRAGADHLTKLGKGFAALA